MSDAPIEYLREDPALRPLIEEHGPLRVEPADDAFRRFATSIINQQLSSASAAAIRDRVFERFEVTPAGMLDADEDALRDAGLSRQKAEYLRNVAAAHRDGEVGRDRFEGVGDDEVIGTLTGIRGVGEWTAKMYLIFCLGRQDVFPVEDLGIRKGMRALFDDEMDRTSMTTRAADWRPYRSYASRYLWRAYDG